ncbi:MAG: DUF4065 domain-containing protein [Balneolales bacterium]|nr:DUF4065 domain-containing protein [Balneolales bacterium]
MKSPVTGRDMVLTTERRSMTFRKETFEITCHFYRCEDSGEQFTTTTLDELNLQQVYNQYRERFNIPFPDEISSIRHQYGLSAAKMSEILGFGVNSYRQYESGEIPTAANAKLIQMVADPSYFKQLVQLSGSLDDALKRSYIQRASALEDEFARNSKESNFKAYLLGNPAADVYSGYKKPSFEKLAEMIVYFSQKLEPFKTKLNKLLFYADFLMYKQHCFSISGVRYRAIHYGPVPNNYQSILEYLANSDVIQLDITEFSTGYSGEKLKSRSDRPFKSDLFSETELQVLQQVASHFKDISTKDTIELSHVEDAWKHHIPDKSIISYEHAFALKEF